MHRLLATDKRHKIIKLAQKGKRNRLRNYYVFIYDINHVFLIYYSFVEINKYITILEILVGDGAFHAINFYFQALIFLNFMFA